MLRLAERAACIELQESLKQHLMPHQVGVAVKGGLSMWATTVEAMMQLDTDNVLLSIDLTNCFNACDRDMLIQECLQHEPLKPMARYVEATYPPGIIAWARVEDDWPWRAINMRTGLAQGRPLSPALACILLQPCILAARDAMSQQAKLSPTEARDKQAAVGYLDDVGLVAHLPAVIAGFFAFQREAAARGWSVNPSKTVLGINLYKGESEQAREVTTIQQELIAQLPAEVKVDNAGLILLGTPCGAEQGE